MLLLYPTGVHWSSMDTQRSDMPADLRVESFRYGFATDSQITCYSKMMINAYTKHNYVWILEHACSFRKQVITDQRNAKLTITSERVLPVCREYTMRIILKLRLLCFDYEITAVKCETGEKKNNSSLDFYLAASEFNSNSLQHTRDNLRSIRILFQLLLCFTLKVVDTHLFLCTRSCYYIVGIVHVRENVHTLWRGVRLADQKKNVWIHPHIYRLTA